MKIELQGRPEVTFEMTRSLHATLMACSEMHYDLTCRMASDRNGPKTGILVSIGWEFLHDAIAKSTQVTLTFRQLDLIAKIREFPGPNQRTAELEQFRADCFTMFRVLNQCSAEWRKELEI